METTSFTVFYKRSTDFPGRIPKVAFCEEYDEIAAVDAASLDAVFRAMNVVDGTELPVSLRCRSLSVGDVVVDSTGQAHYCAPTGWSIVAFV